MTAWRGGPETSGIWPGEVLAAERPRAVTGPGAGSPERRREDLGWAHVGPRPAVLSRAAGADTPRGAHRWGPVAGAGLKGVPKETVPLRGQRSAWDSGKRVVRGAGLPHRALRCCGGAGPTDRVARIAGLSPPQVLAWSPRSLALVPSDLVAGGGEEALEQPTAGLLVLLHGAGLDAQASRPSLIRRFGAVLN
ncbi:hypothetical protein NDU88_004536 [Pleurodeles waltl]|uniref:Uncharacterized protein n=1 Tax=Pleurodeles waltl TaxID=8319 RepID=A0AAV7N1Q6_PLEWA|nr:hypothetical protein NDU88_004536 [Pleurodeles waltl]